MLGVCGSLLAPPSAADNVVPLVPTVTELPLGLPSFPELTDAPVSVDYGAFLFQSKLLSSDQSLACASCHVPALGFSGASPTVIGVGGQQGRRHAPPIFNLYLGKNFMLDGRAASLAEQLPMPIES